MTNNLSGTKIQEKKPIPLTYFNGVPVYNQALRRALMKVPYYDFIPARQKSALPLDTVIPLDRDRAILPPPMVAKILSGVAINPKGSALCIGSGTGYMAAVLSYLYTSVIAIESLSHHIDQAKETFQDLAIDNVVLFNMPLPKGNPQQSPYDLIMIEGGCETVPPQLFDQLGTTGQLVTYIPLNKKTGQVVCYSKTTTGWDKKVLLETWLPLLPEFRCDDSFNF